MNVLLADDDKDDCLLFKEALEELSINASLVVVHDGEQLLQHLEMIIDNLPHVLFLDLNMPRKNGHECLAEIKNHPILRDLRVIIYSTSYDEEKANLLYKIGAHCYIRKPSGFEELKNVLQTAVMLLGQSRLRVSKRNFYINENTAEL
jgi:CheY-like chemotaxis protein